MTVSYGRVLISCDRVTEQSGRYTLWDGPTPIRVLANVPKNLEITVEGGEIEHIPTPIEAAEDAINDLQADLAAAAASVETWQADYEELLADDEAKRSRLQRIDSLVASIGEAPSLAKLSAFLADLKDIINEIGGANGEA